MTIGHVYQAFAKAHQIPVPGWFPEHLNTVELAFLSKEGKARAHRTIQARAGAAPGRLDIDILKMNCRPMLPGFSSWPTSK